MRYAYVGCRTKERNARGEGLKTYEIQPDGSWKCLQCLETKSQTRLFRLWMAKENIFTVFMGILRRFPVTVF